MIGTAIARIEGAAIVPPLNPPAADPLSLARLSHVPAGHSVAVLAGHVVIYDTGRLGELEEGGLYVIESQRAPGGMSPETYHRRSLDHFLRREPPVQLVTERQVVRAARWQRDPNNWQYTTAKGFTEYPLYEWGLRDLIVGRVVGIYASNGKEVRQ
jgi:hypothetical protein